MSTEDTLFSLADAKTWIVAGLIAVGTAVSWGTVMLAGGASHLAPHLFYVPVGTAAVRFRYVGGVAVAALAAIVAGPLLPADVTDATSQATFDWLSRGIFFVLAAVLMSALVASVERSYQIRMLAADQQRQLNEQATAIVQSVSHEFRTPLTVLAGGLELLSEKGLVVAAGRPLLGAMERAGQRLDHLTRVVLAAADRVPDVSQDESIVLLDQLISEVAVTLPRDGVRDRLQINITATAPAIVTRPACLRTILGILLDNALKFSPVDQPVVVEARRQSDHVTITIRDHGSGISDGDHERLYLPFAQLDRDTADAKGGLGLGLYAARRLAQQIGATVDLRHAPGGGTVAWIRIPQRRETDQHPDNPAIRIDEEAPNQNDRRDGSHTRDTRS